MFEFANGDGTYTFISTGNNKLYTGTTTLTEMPVRNSTNSADLTYSITDNNWQIVQAQYESGLTLSAHAYLVQKDQFVASSAAEWKDTPSAHTYLGWLVCFWRKEYINYDVKSVSYRKSATKYAHKKNDRINRSPSKIQKNLNVKIVYVYEDGKITIK